MRSRIEERRFLSIAGAALLGLALWGDARVRGDGHEYAFMTEALAARGSPDVRAEDAYRLVRLARATPELEYKAGYFQAVGDLISKRGPEHGWILRGQDGGYYGLHFWFYPAIAAVPKLLLRWLGGDELRAAQLTNALLMLGACAYLLLLSSLPPTLTWPLSGHYLLTGSILYLGWCTPEVYIGTGIFLACVAMLEVRPRASAAFAAAAALQNPVALLLLPLCFATGLPGWRRSRDWLRALQTVAIGAAGLAPMAFCQWKFGVPSLIARYGFVDSGLLDFQRWWSLLFDLNQGMIVGAAGVMIASAGVLVRGATGLRRRASPNWQARLPLAAAAVLSMGFLVQTNWNAGQSAFLRYAYWCALPLAVWVAARMHAEPALRPWLRITLVAQLVICVLHGTPTLQHGDEYVTLKPWSRWLMTHAPGLLHPEPEIFVERVIGGEIHPAWYDAPVALKDDEGTIRKVALRQTVFPQLDAKLCGAGQALHRIEGEPPYPRVVAGDLHPAGRYDWVWLDGRFRCL